jgi:hypothetical protein
MTLRYDALDPAWADRAIDWLSSRGVHTAAVLLFDVTQTADVSTPPALALPR